MRSKWVRVNVEDMGESLQVDGMREVNLPEMFQALANELAVTIEGGPAAWSELQNEALRTLIKRSEAWRQGDPVPVAIGVAPHTKPTICRNGDLLLGFVRLSAATEATELRLEIGGQDFGKVHIGPQAGAFTFAHEGRFVVPLISTRYHEVKAFPGDDPSIGVVWGFLDRDDRREVCHSKSFSNMGDGVLAWYTRGVAGIGRELPTECQNPLLELPDMRAMVKNVVRVVDGFLSPEECASLLEELGAPGPPCLVPAPERVLSLVQSRVAATFPSFKICGTRCGYGDTSRGMHSHRDEAYQGGVRTLLVYLTAGGGGGETVFEGGPSVTPAVGRAVLFHVRHMHHVEPVKGDWHKVIVAFECDHS